MPRKRETERRRARERLADCQSTLQRAQEHAALTAAGVEAAAEVPEQLGRALAARRMAMVDLETAAGELLTALADYQLTAWTDTQLMEIAGRRASHH